VEARGEVRENSRQEGWIEERRWCGRSRLVAAAGGGGAVGGRTRTVDGVAPRVALPVLRLDHRWTRQTNRTPNRTASSATGKQTPICWSVRSGNRARAGRHSSISTNGANRPTQRTRVRNVYRWHWLSKRKAITKKVTSQYLAGLGALCGWASFVAGQLSKSARQRISVDSTNFGPSHPHHSLVLDRVFSINAPVGQTVPRSAVWTVGAIGGDALREASSRAPISCSALRLPRSTKWMALVSLMVTL